MHLRAAFCLTSALTFPIFAQVAEQPPAVSLPIPETQRVAPPNEPPRRLKFASEAINQRFIAKFADDTGTLTNSHIFDDPSGINVSGVHTYFNMSRLILMYPNLQGYGNDVSGMMAGTQTLGMGFNSEGTFTGTAAQMSGRQMYFADFVASALRGAIDSNGTWWFGSSTTNFGLKVAAPAGSTVGTSIDSAGNMGVGGAADTAYKFKVYGAARFEGTVTGTKIQAHYQDVAEWVPSAEDLAPGTVVVLDPRADNTVKASNQSYDTKVAGVVSGEPGIILGIGGSGKEQIATTGRVKVRVDARTNRVQVGDLLVTSDVAGTAMLSEPMQINGRSFHQPGTIIGKALEPLEGGIGEILVLLSMQ